MLGWHFTNDKLRDGRPMPAVGEWLEHEGAIIPCESGLHISAEPFDALQYAPGQILHRVELEGELLSHGNPVDKWAGRRRRIIESKDCEQFLRCFACDMALSVKDKWDMPEVVEQYLTTMDESKSAAARAASAAARGAARGVARGAACAAASAAARAERAAVLYTARAKQRTEFNKRVNELFKVEP